MKILTLSIKQKYFDQIISGEKKHEFREVRHNNFSRYARYTCNGKEYENADDLPQDGDIGLTPVKYDAIKFLTGEYKGVRPFAIVEVVDAEVYVLTDEDGKEMVYEHEGEEYLASEIDYTLGEVIENHNIV